ncbi:hypothetical protein DBT_0398 [Dissulfuribacter thermophilus]|uniref:HicB-like antitoxin of toxin-antitoxin system domain-containing protein n=1 Tax=Dissulfuribacter thermophilus TaxID=1156395 RepID=A0A1B9F9J6_9BACT|nr:type II toxin-antitoxin system HicB family antitoxin [Dissulfuribacter thermophilus]OCC16580.1 hypothetical protein DBT_0398 [Dissulfuribacter thermophilus]
MKTNELPYPVVVFYSDEDEGYIATVPDLKGCSAFGNTPDEALKEIKIAMELWIQTCKESGEPLPVPSKMAA